ncbi:MAG: ArnT family glycosyltransferase [Tranquillimonas sp.]
MAGAPDAAQSLSASRRALLIVAAVTLARIAVLAVLPLDLWVDEAQYWLWGQHPDWGYFSKPPLIGWTIGAFTWLFGDSLFAIRLPGPLFHGATALILGRLAGDLFGPRAGLWTAAAYVTLPMAALGSVIISTDTILAPFYAGALLAWHRLAQRGGAGWALTTGALLGLAFLAKYAALYFLPGAVLAAALAPGWRVRWRDAALVGGAFALVAAPNLLWNLANDLTTLAHTAQNMDWDADEGGLDWDGLAEFVAAQFAVIGPVFFAALVAMPLRRPGTDMTALLCHAWAVLAIVMVQAVVSGANANWGVVAYFAGTAAFMSWLMANHRRSGRFGLALNAAVSLLIPALFLAPLALTRPSGRAYLERYAGRSEMSGRIVALAQDAQAGTVITRDRGVLADLFYSGRDSGLTFRSVPPAGAPGDYYQQRFAAGAGDAFPALYVDDVPPPAGCDATPVADLAAARGAYARKNLSAWLLASPCLSQTQIAPARTDGGDR